MRAHLALRIATLLLVVAGLAIHLIIGTMIGLGLAALGLLAHVVAAVVARRWWRRQAGSRPSRLARR